jgi:sugar lactone lactonase YvrE
MLGGGDRKTLFVLVSDESDPELTRANRTAGIVAVEVEVPGVGLP